MKQFRDTRYYCTPYGEVYSKTKNGFRFLKPFLDKDGYKKHTLSNNGLRFKRFVHQIIYESWIGEYEKNMTLDHKDFNKKNNNISNLRLMNRAENSGRKKPKSSFLHPGSYVTPDFVLKVKELYSRGITPYRMSKDFGWSITLCKNIAYGLKYNKPEDQEFLRRAVP